MKARTLLWVGSGALLFAFLVGWLLAPGGLPHAPSVPADRYFDQSMLDRANEYRSDRRLLAMASLALQFALLAFLAIHRGPSVRRLLDRAGQRPYLGALGVGATISLLLTLTQLPLDLIAFNLGRDYGLVTQDVSGWLGDLLVASLIGCGLAAIGAVFGMWLWRYFRGRFWIAGSILVIAWAALTVWLWPVVVSPLFNDYELLPDGPVRTEVLRLANQAGVDIGEVYEVDASRRSSTLNASVTGIGSSKRVVIYDNAINKLDDAELSSLIAHELGHVESHDLYRGLGFAILVIPLGVLFVQIGTTVLARRRGDDLNGPAIIPALALCIAATTIALSVPGNVLSRNIEANADKFALELTDDPDGMIGLQQQLGGSNLSDPDPPGLYQYLFGTHPATLDRIAAAEEFKKETGDR